VRVSGPKKISRDQSQDEAVGSVAIGYSGVDVSFAQTFVPQLSGRLSTLWIFIGNIDGVPYLGNLSVEIRTTSGVDNHPTSTVVGTPQMASQDDVVPNSWNSFYFSDVQLTAGNPNRADGTADTHGKAV
jgi:hypothetical protein